MSTTMKEVFQILEDPPGKARWIRIGKAFVNSDGSLNAYLDAIPREGKIHIRDPKPSTKKEEQR